MLTRPLQKSDFDEIVQVIDKWWGGPTTMLVHPIFYYELGQAARVVEHNGAIVGFLLGFITTDVPPVGYLHIVAVNPEHRRRQIATRLYDSFEDSSRSAGCIRMKATTTIGNEVAVQFHKALGWKATIVEHYAGPGRHRYVFTKELA